jgi:proteasome lid subunit RPN8/RPN11
MDARIQDVPGYFVWEAPGKSVVVHLNLDVVDRLSVEVMRGFGAVRKRGAEVGGLLLGTIEEGFPTLVRVDDFALVPCEYRRGPSYLFTEEDSPAFEQAHARLHPIGYFRSHTREGFELSEEDIQLLDHFFPKDSNIALLVRPFAMKTSVGGIFLRENGQFSTTTPLEFPFRRSEMMGEEEPARGSLFDRSFEAGSPEGTARAQISTGGQMQPEFWRNSDSAAVSNLPAEAPGLASTGGEAYADAVGNTRSRPGSWVWIPISFVFLVLGGVLGFEAARTISPAANAASRGSFSLGLAVNRSGTNLNVRWDGNAPVIQSASRGLLEIEDGDTSKSLDLDAAQLHNGSLVYRNTSDTVRFRLTVNPEERLAVTETLEWKP